MISLGEIRNRSHKFAKEWEGATYERGEAQTFWNEFFQIFDISRRRVATFEEPIKKLGGSQGFIDLFWKGQLLIEHKSLGKDLKKAKTQAYDYFPNIHARDLPKYVLVCDFANFELYDLDENLEYHFPLSELHKNIEVFGFIAGYIKKTYKPEEPTNRAAAELMGKLHDKLLENGYHGHDLELYLTRLLFCMFAEDTGIFGKNSFREFIENHTDEDGRNLGSVIAHIFQIFDTPQDKRPKNLDESLASFPYINGAIFSENLRIANFDRSMREMLIEACAFDWSVISPAIFGSMFQASMDVGKRGELGAHFTSEQNILKAIKPLFLDELWDEFEKVKRNEKKLLGFHAKISSLKFLDPACGSGNFLVIAYRELKQLELEVLKILKTLTQQVNVSQLFGFEIEELPSRIAHTAMLLIEHQMSLVFAQTLGESEFNTPIKDSANIYQTNALMGDWHEILNKTNEINKHKPRQKIEIDYIIGNPPFQGKNSEDMTKEQKEDLKFALSDLKKSGELDFVAGWYIKSAQYMQGRKTKAALVSTNSITQGEQVSILWQELFNHYHVKIHFAHKTFKWSNEAKRNAAVYCVIIGFAAHDTTNKKLFEYETVKSEPHEIVVNNINPYLVAGSDFFVSSKRSHIQNFVPQIVFGSMPNDGGNLLFTEEEKEEFLKLEPKADKYIKPLISAKEYLNGKNRYCLWLKDCPPNELRAMPKVLERVENIKKLRSESNREATKKLAKTPMLFGEDRQPDSDYVFIPLTSSETRDYIPMGFFAKDSISNNTASIIPNATLYHFGILTSKMHMDWMRYVCGRLKSDYRYSNEIVYNNFPFPLEVSEKDKTKIEELTQTILNVRSEYTEATLADMYNQPMPSRLLKAHEALDKAVDKLYRKEGFKSDIERVAHLFELNQKLTSLVVDEPKKSKRKSQ